MSNVIKKSPSSPLLHLLGATGAADGLFMSVFGCCNFFNSNNDTMRRRAASSALLIAFISLFLFASFSLYYYNCRNHPIPNLTTRPLFPNNNNNSSFPVVVVSNAIREEQILHHRPPPVHDRSSSNQNKDPSPGVVLVDSLPILFTGWEVLVVVTKEESLPVRGEDYSFSCLYPNKASSPARRSAPLPSTNQTTFRCQLPPSVRRRFPFHSPALVARSPGSPPPAPPPRELIAWWNNLVYESVSTEDDVVLFAKGVNTRQGINTPPRDLRCVFFVDNGANNRINNSRNLVAVKTAVTSSVQEVFRCKHPDLAALPSSSNPNDRIKVSIELSRSRRAVVQSVARYTPPPSRRLASSSSSKKTHSICAMTMVYNAGKFLREWVTYHASIGVEKFILYDNDSDDDTQAVVDGLRRQGFEIETPMWIWPKAQEAGFSHAALRANGSCTWVLYADVDEFVFSPGWINSPRPSPRMLQSLIPTRGRPVGQVSIRCNEFGPSNQTAHPTGGVTQGYTCRRRLDNRHKSLVLLEAVDPTLLNAIHHFKIDERRYRWKHAGIEGAVVNHYKYQAWGEFKAKFRRRVSAYVVDWTKNLNPTSQDRTPGLGFQPVEPPGWAHKFCEVEDDRLKVLARQWFGETLGQDGNYRMAWELR